MWGPPEKPADRPDDPREPRSLPLGAVLPLRLHKKISVTFFFFNQCTLKDAGVK